MILKTRCPECKKPAVTVSERVLAGILFKTYQCGHEDPCPQLSPANFLDFTSMDGKHPYKFQVEGALFGIASNARCLIADEMGLGKTVQALMIAWSCPKELTRILVLCKAGLKSQWSKEVTRWCGDEWLGQVINNENDSFVPGVKALILSFDTLWRFKDIEAWVKRSRVKLVILDEVQHIKNSDSKRTNGVREVCRYVDHVVGLSGTPIKNHAGEYFPILNLLRPDLFPSKKHYDQVWVDSYWDGDKLKYGGLKNAARFFEFTKSFILRRTRQEVLPDLPSITRDYKFSELGPVVEEAYKSTLRDFQQYYNYGGINDSAIQKSANILAYLSKMRHLTGIAKIEPVIDYVQDFLESTDRKIVIFCHHKDVGAALLSRLEELREQYPQMGRGILSIQGIDADARAPIVEMFANPDFRVLIAGELASSEGLNLQFCSDCILMERQWNPANEEQAEARFIRIGQTALAVNAMYPIAVGTVDEFFSEIVEKKRGYCANVVDGVEYVWEESSLMQELAEVLAQSGGRKWGW